jgi:hypothetical protein
MATVQSRGKYWAAKWRDSSGKQYCRSTGEVNRKAAQKAADAWEEASRKGIFSTNSGVHFERYRKGRTVGYTPGSTYTVCWS